MRSPSRFGAAFWICNLESYLKTPAIDEAKIDGKFDGYVVLSSGDPDAVSEALTEAFGPMLVQTPRTISTLLVAKRAFPVLR
jgi:hypothetical protein